MREISKRVEKEIVELQKQVSFSGKCTYNLLEIMNFSIIIRSSLHIPSPLGF
jgi:hypothetical protein